MTATEQQCARCGGLGSVKDCVVDGAVLPLCPECRKQLIAQTRAAGSAGSGQPIHYLKGTLGALIGGVAGVLLILLVMQIGYITTGGGLALGAATMFLFKKFGHGINAAGLAICLLVSLLAAYLALQLNLALLLIKEVQVDITVFDALRVLPELKAQKILDMDAYYEDLLKLFGYTGFGLVLAVLPGRKKNTKKRENEAETHEDTSEI